MTQNFTPGLMSVIVPAYNAEAYLAETLASVLRQNWEPLELLVVDDGSSDRTVAVAKDFGDLARVIACSHRGLAATRNSGITAAHGEFILHLDADDLLTPMSIFTRMQHFTAEATFDMVVGKLMCFLSPELSNEERARYAMPPDPQQGHLPGAAIIRAAAFDKYGLLDERLAVNADLDWWVRARDEGARVRLIEDVVVKRRIHGKNLTLMSKAELDASRLQIVRASLARRRRGMREVKGAMHESSRCS
jgi:glycosyltransferase involved in cell wall biosynthesis